MWICAQIGAREHYAVPRALHREGRLGGLYTDFRAGSALRSVASSLPIGPIRSLGARHHPDLADARVEAWNLRSLSWEFRGRFWSRRGGGSYRAYAEIGSRFACAVRNALRRRELPPGAVFFAYDTGALEAMDWLRGRGVICVLDQMDPNRVEVELVREEERRWPGWQARSTEVPEDYFARREREWELADRIVVNSEFSRRALLQQGVPAEKLAVVPLCYETSLRDSGPRSERERKAPLRVLWLGQVILRKGIPYLLEAARLLVDEPIVFDVVGSIGISAEALASAPPNVRFHGRVGREEIGDWYRRADLFVLPTVSDGFALTQLEAMAHGAPVIGTPNCGDVVTHEVDGMIVPVRDSESLARALLRYLNEPELLAAHRAAAPRKARQFSLAHLATALRLLEN